MFEEENLENEETLSNSTEDVDKDIKKKKQEKSAEEEVVKDNLITPETNPNDYYAKQIVEGLTKPEVAVGMPNKENFTKQYKDGYIKKFNGDEDKASKALDETYELLSLEYQKQAQAENSIKMLESVSFLAFGRDDIDFVGANFSPDIEARSQNVSGRMQILDTWTDPTRSVREAALLSKKVIDSDGNTIEVKEDAYDELTYNDAYTDKDGNRIKNFVYTGYNEYGSMDDIAIKAVYENQDPEGEVVSRYDTSKSFLSSNGLDTSTWKVAVGSVADFVVDTLDTALALTQYATIAATYGMAGDTDYYKGIKNWRDALKTGMMSKSDADQESMLTINNALNLGINIGGQLLTGKALATAFSKVFGVGIKASESLAALGKEAEVAEQAYHAATTAATRLAAKEAAIKLGAKYTKMYKTFNRAANKVKASTLFAMGAMQAKGTADEARAVGYSEKEAAAIYFGSLGMMMVANNLSDLGFERLGLNASKGLIKSATKDGLTGMTPKLYGYEKVVAKTFDIAKKVRTKVVSALDKAQVVQHMGQEAIEEETEFIFDELVKHTASALSVLGKDDGENAPKFQTVNDAGYWKNFWSESLMNITGGALGGAMSGVAGSNFFKKSKGVKEAELPQKGTTAETMKFIAYYSTRTGKGKKYETELFEVMSDMDKKGGWGRDDISDKWDNELKRFKRVNELTDAEKSRGHASQAMVQKTAFMNQYLYYKSIYSNSTKTYDEIIEENPEFSFVKNSDTMFKETKAIMSEKAEIYSKSNAEGDIDFDDNVKQLSEIKDKLKEEDDDTKYQEKLSKFSKVTGLEKADLERLMVINDQLEDISTGRALETSFIKYQLDSPEFKGKITYKQFKNLIEQDIKAQKDTEENIKKGLVKKAETKKVINSGVKADEALSPEMINYLTNVKSDELFIENDDKVKLHESVSKLGNSFEKQRRIVAERIYEDVKSNLLDAMRTNSKEDLEIRITEGGNIVYGVDAVKSILNVIKSNLDTPENIYSTLSTMAADINIDGTLGTDDNSSLVKYTYSLQKLSALSGITTKDNFASIKYDLSKSNSRIFGDILTGLQRHTSFQPIHGFNAETTTTNISALFDLKENQQLTEFLDPELKLKTALHTIIGRAVDLKEGMVRPDLLFGFKTLSTGRIVVNTDSLDTVYYKLVKDKPKKKGTDEPAFFSDLDSAMDLKSQIELRLVETQFIRKFLPTFSKIRSITNQNIKNAKPELSFLTTYIDKFLIEFDEYDDIAGVMHAKLEDYENTLLGLQEKTDKLVEMAQEASEDLEAKYVGDAIVSAHNQTEEIIDVLDIISNGSEFKNSAELTEVRGILNTIDFDDKTNDNLAAIYESINNVKKILNGLYKTNTEEFLDSVVNSYSNYDGPAKLAKFNTFLLFSMSPADKIYGRMLEDLKTISEEAIKGDGFSSTKIPTIPQLLWVEEGVTSAYDHNYLKTISKFKKDASTTYKSITAFNARQGSGKTLVTSKYIAEILTEIFAENGNEQGVLFAANTAGQSKNMLNGVNKSKVEVATLGETKEVDQDILWKNIVDDTKDYGNNTTTGRSIEEVSDLLFSNKVGVILFDEITNLEFNGALKSIAEFNKNKGDTPILNGILSVLDEVNAYRARNSGKGEAIVMLGFGDDTQPGFIHGMKTPRNPKGLGANQEFTGEKETLFDTGSDLVIHISSKTLKRNFRSIVEGMADSIEEFQEILTSPVKKKSGDKYVPAELVYDDSDGSLHGIRMQKRGLEAMLNDSELIGKIRKRLEDDPDFTLALIAGELDTPTTVTEKDSLFKTLKEDFPDRVTTYSFYSMPGFEATYTLAYVPSDFFGIDNNQFIDGTADSSVKRIFADKVSRLKTAMGRSYEFVEIAYEGSLELEVLDGTNQVPSKGTAIVNKRANITVKAPKADAVFKESWSKTMIDYILAPYEGKASKTTEKSELVVTPKTPKSTTKKVVIKPEAKHSVVEKGKSKIGAFINSIKTSGYSTDIKNDIDLKISMQEAVKEVASKYNFNINGPINDVVIEQMIDKLINLSKSDTADKENVDAAIARLKNYKDILYDNHEIGSIILEEINTLLAPSEDSSPQTDKDVMAEAEAEGNIVAYNTVRLSGKDLHRDSINNKHYIATQIYGALNIMDKNESLIHNEKIKTWDENGNFNINTKDYTYYIVTYKYGKSEDSESFNHVLVGEYKGKRFVIAQFPKLSDFSADGLMRNFFNNRIKTINEKITNPNNEAITIIQFNSDIARIESKLDMPEEIITGMTVGNVITGSQSLKNEAVSKGLIKEEDFPFTGRKNSTVMYSPTYVKKITKLKTATKDPLRMALLKTIDFNSKDYPFKSFENDGNYFIFNTFTQNGSKYRYLLVKTIDGIIPMVNKEGERKWYPAVGVVNNTVLINKDILKNKNRHYNKEVALIADQLNTLEKEFTNEEYLKLSSKALGISLINEELGIKDDILNTISNSTAEVQINTLTRKLQDKTGFFGDLKIPFSEAKEFWKTTGSPKSITEPMILPAGPHAGKALVLYTFNSNLKLDKMSSEEIIDVYERALKHRNKEENESVLSDNRLGIGMLLLDVEGTNFSGISELRKGQITKANVNKTVVSGKSEKILLSMFSAMHKYLNDSTDNIVTKLTAEDENSDINNKIVEEWLKVNSSKNPGYIKLLSVFLDKVFKKENLGIITTTLEGDENLSTLLESVSLILANTTGLTKETIKERIEEALDIYRNNGGDLKLDVDTVKTLEISKNTNSSTGYLLLNNHGKLVIYKNPFTIITAIDETLIKDINNGDISIIPDPKFDIDNMISLLENELLNKQGLDLKGLMKLLDTLIPELVGLEHGIFISPIMEPTSRALAKAEDDASIIYTTTVKQIKEPQLVFSINNINSNLTDIEEKKRVVEKGVEKEVSLEREIKGVFGTIKKANTKNDFKNIIEYIESISDKLPDGAKENIYEILALRYNEVFDISGKDLRSLNLSDVVAPIPGTEQLIEQLNNLKGIFSSEMTLDSVDSSSLTKAQSNRVRAIFSMFTDDPILDLALVKAIYKGEKELPNLKLTSEYETSILDIVDVINTFSYPTYHDLTDNEIIGLLIGVTAGLVAKTDAVKKALTWDKNKKGNKAKLFEWVEKSFNFSKDRRASVTDEFKQSVSDSINIDELDENNILKLDSDTIMVLINFTLHNDGSYQLVNTLLNAVDYFIENSDVRLLAFTKLATIVDKSIAATGLTQEANDIKNELNNFLEEDNIDTTMNTNEKMLGFLNSQKGFKDLFSKNPEAKVNLTGFINTLTEEELEIFKQFLTDDYNDEAKKLDIPDTHTVLIMKKLDAAISDGDEYFEIADILGELKSDENIKCVL